MAMGWKTRVLGPAQQVSRALLAGALVLLGAGTAMAQPRTLEQVLAYDASAPLQLRVLSRQHKPGVLVEEVSFRGVTGATIAATIVKPTWINGPHAGILWGHWYEPGNPTSNRTQFLGEAQSLARLGVVSVMPDTLWTDHGWFGTRSWRNDYRDTVDQARNFRRALDVLLAQHQVDASRIAFVGHDFSAMHGALISAVDPRPKAYVLIAGTARWADWYLFGAADGKPAGDDLAAYLAQLAVIDPIVAVAQPRGKVAFQFGEDDFYTPRANFTAFYAAAPLRTTRLSTYEAHHEMAEPIIRLERDAWLGEQLDLPFLRKLAD